MSPNWQNLTGLRQIVDQFDIFLFDVWGTLHNGERLIPEAAECLKVLRDAQKSLFLLSNVPRPRNASIARLQEMGLERPHYTDIITAGELVHQTLRQPQNGWYGNFFYLGPDRDRDLFQHIHGLQEVPAPSKANFVLNAGPKEYSHTLKDYEPLLEQCIDYKLPMLCANPDRVVIVGTDYAVICAGTLAHHYESSMNGKVYYYGKPYSEIYEWCFRQTPSPTKERILAIGDNLLTDIKGANDIGISNVLLTTGIHYHDLYPMNNNPSTLTALPEQHILTSFFQRHNCTPSYLMSRLVY